MNTFEQYVDSFTELIENGSRIPLAQSPSSKRTSPATDAPCAIIFSPHPDDEVIIGALPYRLAQQCGWRVINVAVTQGSDPKRRSARWAELQKCCDSIGFELIATSPGGLTNINASTREQDSESWSANTACITGILNQYRPSLILYPHADDWNSTHIGTHLLINDALRAIRDSEFSCFICETEFWGQMQNPNLMVEVSGGQLADLISALSFHIGEIQRNPYHLTLPAWMIDNTRRGTELVGGQGGDSPGFRYAVLYRLLRWSNGSFTTPHDGGKMLAAADDPAKFLSR